MIVAGGEGKRLGGGKPLLPFGRGVLLDAVIAKVGPQVETLALNVPKVAAQTYRERYGSKLTLLFDPIEKAIGPLNGILAGLEWLERSKRANWLASFPCDTPFLPSDLVAQLYAAGGGPVPVAADDNARVHGLCAIWPVACARELRIGLEQGRLRSVMSAVDALGGRTCRIDCGPDAFFNVNTPTDLASAEGINARRSIP